VRQGARAEVRLGVTLAVPAAQQAVASWRLERGVASACCRRGCVWRAFSSSSGQWQSLKLATHSVTCLHRRSFSEAGFLQFVRLWLWRM